MPYNPEFVQIFILQIWSTLPIQDINHGYANILAQTCYTIGLGEEEVLPKIRNALPIRQDIAY